MGEARPSADGPLYLGYPRILGYLWMAWVCCLNRMNPLDRFSSNHTFSASSSTRRRECIGLKGGLKLLNVALWEVGNLRLFAVLMKS